MANKFSVDAIDIMPGLQMLGGAIREGKKTRADYERARVKEEKERQFGKEMENIITTGTPEEIMEFRSKNPSKSKDIESAYKFKNDLTKENKINTAMRIINGEDPAQAEMERADFVLEQGGEIGDTLKNTYTAMAEPPEKAKDRAWKDLARLLEPKKFKEIRGTYGLDKEAGKTNRTTDIKNYEYAKEQGFKGSFLEFKALNKDKDEKITVGAQEFLEDGTLIQSTPQGPRVYSPQQVLLKGQDAADAIAKGRFEKVSNERKKSEGRRTGALEAERELKGEVEAGIIGQKEAAKISVDAFKRLEPIRKNINNLNEGISLLREKGARTGVITRYLPSIESSSIKLDNLQGRLGLDIVSTTTFGSLSEAELRFALDTAMPKNLQPAELAGWLEEKKKAQEKLSDTLESAAIYLGTPGNTVSGWIKKNKVAKAQKKAAPMQPQYKEGQTATVNGKPLIFTGGQWRDR